MKNLLREIVVFCALFLPVCVSAQMIPINEIDTYIQKVRIGLVDEFFDRFNGKTTHPDIPEGEDCRINNLLMLLDLAQYTSRSDSLFIEAAAMMRTVISDSVRINYADATWTALAHCKGSLEEKTVRFDLFLSVQHRKEDLYKWVITRAEGDIFNITPKNCNDNIMLLPDDHETNFMSLRRMTAEQPYNIKQFLVQGTSYDKTSVFAYLVHSGKLKIDYVEDLEFVFLQIPGYIFHLSYFDRERNNTGWLISKFYKVSEEDKAAFLASLYPPYKPPKQEYNPRKIESDSSRHSDLKSIYTKRLNEKLLQVRDYIRLLHNNDSLRTAPLYKTKMESLFASDAMADIHHNETGAHIKIPICAFCDRLTTHPKECVSIDSISIPIWDDRILELDSSVNKIEVSAITRPFVVMSDGADEALSPKYDKVLYIYKEETEDGAEWLPILGDIYITIK